MPEHQIDPQSLEALPRTPGVYIFQGEGTLPLYIGKSIDIRSRVLATFVRPMRRVCWPKHGGLTL